MPCRKAGNLIQNDRFHCIPVIPFDIPQPCSIWWGLGPRCCVHLWHQQECSCVLCSASDKTIFSLTPGICISSLTHSSPRGRTMWHKFTRKQWKWIPHSSDEESLLYKACLHPAGVRKEEQGAQIREIIVRKCEPAHIWQVTFPCWSLSLYNLA